MICPKCDKSLSPQELIDKVCSNCKVKLEHIPDDEIGEMQKEKILDEFASELLMEKNANKIDYYETAINMLKAYLTGIVCKRNKYNCSFYRIVDCEIVSFLFRVRRKEKAVRIEFDLDLKNYSGVELIPRHRKENGKIPKQMKSFLVTKDFDFMLRMGLAVYERKNRKYKDSATRNKVIKIYYKS